MRSRARTALTTMPKRRRNVPLPIRLLWRRLRSPDGRLAALAALSIAVSVALATGLEMSSRSAQEQLRETAAAIAGESRVEVTAGRVGVPEQLLDEVREIRGVHAAVPFISEKVLLVGQSYPINIIGVDFLSDQDVRHISISRQGLDVKDPLRLLVSARSVVVTQDLLDQLRLLDSWNSGKPTEVRIRAQSHESTLLVQGVLTSRGLAAAFGGQVALMDVFALQNLVGREGYFDRIDVVPSADVTTEQLLATMSTRLAGRASVRKSLSADRTTEESLSMLRRASMIIAMGGAISACLLTYATAAQWIERQRKQLATLRAVGMEAKRVQRGAILELAVISTAGTMLGGLGGFFLSPMLLSALSRFALLKGVEQFTTLTVRPQTIEIAVAVGVVAAFIGGAVPVARAGRRYTLDSVEYSTDTLRNLATWLWAGLGLVIALVLYDLATTGRWQPAPLRRLVLIFILALASGFAFVPMGMKAARMILGWCLGRIDPALGHLVTRSFSEKPLSVALATTAIAAIVGVLTITFLLIASVSDAVMQWTTSRYPGATLVIAGSIDNPLKRELLGRRTLAEINATNGVLAVDEQYRRVATILFHGREVELDAHSMSVLAEYGHLAAIDQSSAELARKLAAGAIAVSPGFSRTFGVVRGDRVELDTPSGLKSYLVAGIVEDFGGSNGSIFLDLATFDASWPREGAWAAAVWLDRPREEVISSIRQRVGSIQDLFFVDADGVAAENRRTSQVFTATLRVIASFMTSLCSLSVSILLLGAVVEQRRQMSLLRAAGAEPGYLIRLVLVDALAVALIGALIGLAVGFAAASAATDVLRNDYGWVIPQRWYAPEIPFLVLGICLAGLLGALAPARLAFLTAASDVFGPD